MVLTDKQKTAYTLYHKRGMKQTEIASLMGVRHENVCRLISRAEHRVREWRLACLEAGGDCKVIDAILN